MKIQLPPPSRRVYKLSPLALALFCFSATALEFNTTVKDSCTGNPSVIIGSEDQRLGIGINSLGNVTVDTKKGGYIDVYSAGQGIYSSFSKASLAVGSTNTTNLNVNTKYVKDTSKGSQINGVGFSGLELKLNGAEINIDVDGGSDVEAIGLAIGTTVVENNVSAQIGSENTKSVKINVNGTKSTGLSSECYTEKTDTTMQAQEISIISTAEEAYGVYSSYGASTNLKAKDTLNIISNGKSSSAAVYAIKNATTELKADTINIESSGNPNVFAVYASESDTTIDGENITVTSEGHGVFVNNATQDTTAPADAAKMIINGNNTVINAGGSGLLAFSNGNLEVNGNLKVNALNAIDTRGHATINVNKDKTATVVLNGNITFETPGANAESGEVLDSNVNVYLTGSGSSWTGNVYKEYNAAIQGNEDKTKVENLYVYLADGARWNATNIGTVESELITDTASFINTLEMDGGIVNTAADLESIQVDKLKGIGGQINLAAETDGENITATEINIGETADNPSLTVKAVGVNADDITNAEAAMESLNDKVKGDVAKQNVIAQGDVIGEITQDVNAAGETSAVRVAENTKLASFKAVNAAAIAAWRDEVAYTNQRLDFLRDSSDHLYGVWAQVYGGRSTFDDADLDLNSTTVQVGFDTSLGGWITGVAASYMEGDADMKNGSADVDGYTFALYTERRFDNGFFVNATARYGRLSTDATAENMSASYDNNAFSIGANGGYRFTFAKYGFVEPSIGLQYAFVQGDDFTSSNGVKVEQDDYNALIGDIGARVGFNFADDMGKLYARAYVNHDFDGDLDGRAHNDKASAAMNVDLGGTWVTYGIGTQMNFTDNFTVYANFDRSSGNEVDTDYMLNAGLRYTF